MGYASSSGQLEELVHAVLVVANLRYLGLSLQGLIKEASLFLLFDGVVMVARVAVNCQLFPVLVHVFV